MIRIRTGYSFREAAGSIDEVISRLGEVGLTKKMPITDRASTFGWVRWGKAVRKAGAVPVFGVELAVTESIHAKKPAYDHWTFLAIDDVANVNRLVELATTQFRYRPLLTIDQALSAEGVWTIIGNRTNPTLLGDPRQRVMFGLGPSTPIGQARLAAKKGWSFAAVSDNRFPREADRGFYEVLCGRNAESQSYAQHILGREEWREATAHLSADQDAAFANSVTILESCNATLPRAELLKPERPATLRAMCEDGAKLLGCDLSNPVYRDRLDRELTLIADKKFEDYFYIVAEMCQWARERMIVGPARGSSCGSLACYLLRITTVDPIPFGLIFERFIDVNRDDLPDIDIDFSDQQRHLVFEHVNQLYGSERVARLGTVAMFQPRSALNEVGAALKLPRYKCDAVAESLIQRSSGDSRALNTLEDTLKSMPAGRTLLEDHPESIVAARFEGHPRHYSQHAAGIVIAERPITDFVAVDHRTGATMCDKKDAEEFNLLKVDALGLTQLSVFEDALELAGLPRDHLEKLSLDDEAAFEVLNKGQWSGIFQFNGMALQSITKQFRVDCFDDIVSVTALGRPGPLASGGAHEWIKRRNGVHPVTFPHPMFEPFMKDTLGIVLYQEQVMEIGRQIGDLNWGQVTALRKAMSKSLGKEYFDQFGDPWKAGAIAKGLDPSKADKVWDDLCLSGETKLINPFPSKGNYKTITLRQLYERGGLGPTDAERPSGKRKRQSLLMWDGQSLKPAQNWGVRYSGKKETYTLKTESGNEIRATGDHKFLMADGAWKKLESISVGDCVLSDSGPIPSPRKAPKLTGPGGHNWWHKLKAGAPSFEEGKRWLKANFKNCEVCKEAPYEETHHVDMNHENNAIDNLMAICRKCHKRLHAAHSGYPKAWQSGRGVFADPVVSIELWGEEDVYDVHMPDPHNNFLAEGIVVHNCAYGAWSFNKSHSVAYGLISYWCCWLKAHFPFEFAAATLSHEDDPDKQIIMLREMVAEGYDYIPVDPAKSTEKWTTGYRDNKKVLVGPLTSVKGIGPKMVEQILSARARGEPLAGKAAKVLADPKTDIDSLFPIRDAFNRIMPRPYERNIHTPPTPIINCQIEKGDREVLVFCTLSKINPRDENEAVIVARRGYEIKDGKTASLNLQLTDDTDTIFGKINRYDYQRMGKDIVERGRVGKALYAVKGTIRGDTSFRMINIKQVRYIGDMDK